MGVWRKVFPTIEEAVLAARQVLPHLSLGEEPIEDYRGVVKAFQQLAAVTAWRSQDCDVNCTIRPHYLYYNDQAWTNTGETPCSLQIDQVSRFFGGEGFIVNAHCPAEGDWRFSGGWEEYVLP